jgi:hypothetical protein
MSACFGTHNQTNQSITLFLSAIFAIKNELERGFCVSDAHFTMELEENPDVSEDYTPVGVPVIRPNFPPVAPSELGVRHNLFIARSLLFHDFLT